MRICLFDSFFTNSLNQAGKFVKYSFISTKSECGTQTSSKAFSGHVNLWQHEFTGEAWAFFKIIVQDLGFLEFVCHV